MPKHPKGEPFGLKRFFVQKYQNSKRGLFWKINFFSKKVAEFRNNIQILFNPSKFVGIPIPADHFANLWNIGCRILGFGIRHEMVTSTGLKQAGNGPSRRHI